MKLTYQILVFVALIFIVCTGTAKFTSERHSKGKSRGKIEKVQFGIASFYGEKFHGRKTASGEIFDMNKLTAAHPSLPFGTIVKVTNLKNNKSVVVRINDRGPFAKNRIIDLSYEAARRLDFIKDGTTAVKIEVIKLPEK
jgi:rare lipoprotein A